MKHANKVKSGQPNELSPVSHATFYFTTEQKGFMVNLATSGRVRETFRNILQLEIVIIPLCIC